MFQGSSKHRILVDFLRRISHLDCGIYLSNAESFRKKKVLPSTLQLDSILISNLTNSIHTVFKNASIAKMCLDRNIVVQWLQIPPLLWFGICWVRPNRSVQKAPYPSRWCKGFFRFLLTSLNPKQNWIYIYIYNLYFIPTNNQIQTYSMTYIHIYI